MKANRRIKTITLTLITLMAAGFAITAGLHQSWGFVIAVLSFGVMWFVLLAANQHFGDTLLFILFVVFSALGTFEGLPLPVMAALLCVNLAAWNLSEFINTLLCYGEIVNQRKLEDLRLRRLAFTLSSAYILTLIPMLIQIQLHFIVILLIAITGFFLLGQALLSLRKQE